MADIDTLATWCETVRPYWDTQTFNSKFWQECIHDQDDMWRSWANFAANVNDVSEWNRKFPHWQFDTDEILDRLERGVHVAIPRNTSGYNTVPFRLAMTIKDIVGQHLGKPFVQPAKTPAQTAITKREQAYLEIVKAQDALRARIDEFFTTGE